jgi:hypothetical protein
MIPFLVVIAIFYCIYQIIDLSIKKSLVLLIIMSDLMALVWLSNRLVYIKTAFFWMASFFFVAKKALFLSDSYRRKLARHRDQHQPLHNRNVQDYTGLALVRDHPVLVPVRVGQDGFLSLDSNQSTQVWLNKELKFWINFRFFIFYFWIFIFNFCFLIWIE